MKVNILRSRCELETHFLKKLQACENANNQTTIGLSFEYDWLKRLYES